MTAPEAPHGWSMYSGTWGTDVDRESTVVRNGKYSIKFFPTAPGSDPGIVSDYIPVDPLDGYRLTWIQRSTSTNSAHKLKMAVEYFDSTKTSLGAATTVYNFNVLAVDTWEVPTYDIQPPATAAFARIIFTKTSSVSFTAYLASVDLAVCEPHLVVTKSSQLIPPITWTRIQFDTIVREFGISYNTGGYYADMRSRLIGIDLDAFGQFDSFAGTYCQFRVAFDGSGSTYHVGPRCPAVLASVDCFMHILHEYSGTVGSAGAFLEVYHDDSTSNAGTGAYIESARMGIRMPY